MSIDRALQWTTAAVAIVGALFLALGHESGWLPALLAVAAAFSVLVTDLIPRLRLNRTVGNLIAVAAVAWSLYDFLDRTSDQQLMAISQMLVILQVLLLFQEKTGRSYWQLLVLSLLQVVVAAALNSGVEYGVLLAVYMVLSLLALVLLGAYRDLQLDRQPLPPVGRSESAPWKALLGRPQVIHPAHATRATPGPLGGRLLVKHLAALTVATTGLTAVFFYMTPRLNDNAWRSQRKNSSSVSGISQQIELEEFGRIHQSNQVVLRVSFTNVADRTSYTMIGEPYFQGGVLTHYERVEGKSRWIYDPQKAVERYNAPSSLWRGDPARSVVRQDCMLELVNSPIAFAVFPLKWAPPTGPPGLRIERAAGRIARTSSDVRTPLGEVRYAGLTTALQHGRQLRAIAHSNPHETFENIADLREELEYLREFDAAQFPGVRAAAQRALREAQVDQTDPFACAQALERHLLFSNLYRYALHLDFQRDHRLDPIEDFVVNHHTGHCEYFASALVLMLRSQGIPARIAIGYKGGEYNMLGKYYVVRQKHAHAWVEAWMPPGAVPESEIAGAVHSGGCWYRLDPTPASNEYLAGLAGTSLQGQIAETFDYLELLWRDYVVNLNSFRQQQSVIDSGAVSALEALPDWIDARSVDGWFRRLGQRLGLPVQARAAARRAFDWRLAAVIVGGLAIVIGVTQVGGLVLRRLAKWLGFHSDTRAGFHRPPAFYRQLERLLARIRIRRDGGQTAVEFAQSARTRLADYAQPPEVTDLPAEVVAAYYRVRFGGDTLDNSESEAIEHALARLVPAVSQAQKR